MMPTKLDAAAALESMDAEQPRNPAFDYSGLDEQTAQTLQNFSFRALQAARTYYLDLMEIVVGAHELLCGVVPAGDNSLHGNRGEATFRAWCASVHISKTKAYQLLQIQDFMDNCTPEQQSTLALLPFTAMREIVTDDTPEQVITMAKEGKIGSSKEVLELKAQLKAEQDRADTAEAARDAAIADLNGLSEQNARLNAEKEQAKKLVDAAEAREEEAWKMHDKAEKRAKAAEEALKHQPITAVVDEEEVDRRAHQQAYNIAADMTDELRTKNNQLGQENAALLRQLEEAKATNSYDPEADLNTVCSCIRSIMDFWEMAFPAFERLTGKAYRNASDYADEAANNILRDMARVESERAQKEGKA